ncbi:DUF6351 family protein [Paracoccus sp. (in: a-proteobacteria)]|uniref:DUF6351 family protein n=1 Tax=Paracoccus sp. TaxID=267 RepID=UPI003A86208B
MHYHRLLMAGVATFVSLHAGMANAQNRASFSESPADAWFDFAPVAPAVGCNQLASLNMKDVIFIKTTRVESDDLPPFCRVQGIIRPEIQFEIALPDNWNRRLYMFGNGGYAGRDLSGSGRLAYRDNALRHGFMSVQQNTGHDDRTAPLGEFADNDLERLVDYTHRAVHVTVETAKELAEVYYSDRPSYSYWDGCSTGGRQGLMSAQRYPGDFDGIVAGAPVLDFSNTQIWGVYNAQQLEKAPISAAQLPALSKAVMTKCDAIDGLEDGLITDPRNCAFEPGTDLQQCDGEAGDSCFTAGQIAALQGIAKGVTVDGKQVFPAVPWGVEGLDPSGESGWNAWIVSENGPSRQLAYGESFLQNMALLPMRGTDIDWRTFDIEKRYTEIGMIRDLVDANDPDLSGFARHGGRMITYFGWADPALNPLMGVNYYESVRQQMGADQTADFYRLFMVPGMFHCRGGYGPDRFDAMLPLMKWVEMGQAPEQIVAGQYEETNLVRTRPLCPYPKVAVYAGTGDTTVAKNFSCRLP